MQNLGMHTSRMGRAGKPNVVVHCGEVKIACCIIIIRIVRADPTLCPKNKKTFQADLQQVMWEFEQANGIDCQSTDYQMSPPIVLQHYYTGEPSFILYHSSTKKTYRIYSEHKYCLQLTW